MRLLLWVGTASLLASGISGGATANARYTGNDLARHCFAFEARTENSKAPNGADAFHQGLCVGIIYGVQEFAHLLTKDTTIAICMPENGQMGQIVSVVVKHLRKNAEKLHLDFEFLVLGALADAFPCKK